VMVRITVLTLFFLSPLKQAVEHEEGESEPEAE
jgi:hypothetical protein